MKLAVIFPGIGYHCDKPLLYYSKRIAIQCGYEIKEVAYTGFEKNIRGDKEKIIQAFQSALQQSCEILKDVEFEQYEKVLFISKSVGTAVAASYASKRRLQTKNVYYTPVEETFQMMKDPGIIFSGTKDPWIDHQVFLRECVKTGYPYHVMEGGNHSLETGDTIYDLEQLVEIMRYTKEYISGIDYKSTL